MARVAHRPVRLGDEAFTTLGSPGGGGATCYQIEYQKRYYLWDEGILLAVFDDQDNVLQMFINGPTGRIGTYVLNQDQHLHYYINDQIGSPRIALLAPPDTTTPHVNESILNHPFGGLAHRSGNHLNNFRFTGHEYDNHSTFDFHYMGARYYDDRIGSFTSVDKASQFASGFNYGGNNPILGRDPDGNFFMFTAPFIMGFTMSTMAAIPQVANNGWEDWWKIPAHGFVGGLSGYIGKIGSPNMLGRNVLHSTYLNIGSGALHGAIDGEYSQSDFGLDVAMGTVWGIITSEHFDNLVTGHGFQSYDDEFGRMIDDLGDNVGAQRYLNSKGRFDVPVHKLAGMNEDGLYPMAYNNVRDDITLGMLLCDENGLYRRGAAMNWMSHEVQHMRDFNGIYRGRFLFKSLQYDAEDLSNPATQFIELPAYEEQLRSIPFTHPYNKDAIEAASQIYKYMTGRSYHIGLYCSPLVRD